MKQSKIFNWLYFFILLLPIMFVLIPMINNYQPSVKSESVEIVEYGVNSFILSEKWKVESTSNYFIIDLELNGFYDAWLNTSTDVYGFCGIIIYNGVDDEYNSLYFYTWNDYYNIFEEAEIEDVNKITYDGTKLYINKQWCDLLEELYISPICYQNWDYAYSSYFSFYYKDYVINTEYNSIFYDFSVKMNDSLHIMGDFTEYIDNNIIDLQVNDYMFFGWTYMLYIFIISLLWLLISFLLFIIKWCYNFLGGVYEKV